MDTTAHFRRLQELKESVVTPEQSRTLNIGQRVSWLGDEQDRGIVVERDWTGVSIKWDNGKTSFHHHNDMRDIVPITVRR